MKTATLALVIFILFTQSAAAFNFGFVRAPDYLDPYFIFLLIMAAPIYLAVLATKPKNVPFNRLYQTKMALLPTIYFRMLQVVTFLTIGLLFVGMALARMAEAGL